MKKFFLFRRQEVSKSSTFASDSGEGVDIFGVPADSLAFMTAELGAIRIVFNNATPYEENNLVDGDSMQKTSVTVSCERGKEMEVIESIMRFVDVERQGSFNIMKFDAVESFSNLKDVSVGAVSDVVSQVRKTPVDRVSGEPSSKTFIGGTAGTALGSPNTIEGIDFGAEIYKPTIDYNAAGITVSSGTAINGWTNSGTGGTAYNATVTNTPIKRTTLGRGATESGSSQITAEVDTTESFQIGTEFKTGNEYTMYIAVANSETFVQQNGRAARGNFYSGDSDGTSFGFGGSIADQSNEVFALRYDTHTGAPAKASGNFTYTYPDAPSARILDVFVVRRDKNNVVYVHDYTGAIVATFDEEVVSTTKSTRTSKTSTKIYDNVKVTPTKELESRSVNESGRLDGVLAIKNFGGAVGVSYSGSTSDPKFDGKIARFGVIERDLGTERASRLATDLYDYYKPIS